MSRQPEARSGAARYGRRGGARERSGRSVWPVFRSLLLAGLAIACSSPNRGRWEGSFEGGISGTMHFDVNTRGTRAEGRIVGTTSRGQDFRADFEGTLNHDYLRADFEGSGESGFGVAAGFRGELSGTLAQGRGEGKWRADLLRAGTHWEGRWRATQVEVPD